MRQVIRYQSLIIPGKMRCEVRLLLDLDRPAEFTSSSGDTQNTGITLFPMISLTITKPADIDENGQRVRAPWNPNDSLGMTKFTLPVFAEELREINKDMKTPELYTYHGKRLELNEAAAEKIRRVFMIGNTAVELSAVVVTQTDDTRVEGIKIKFNNEQSSVILTLNEINALSFNLDHMDIDSIALMMYTTWTTRPDKPKVLTSLSPAPPKVDIIPKEDFKDDFV